MTGELLELSDELVEDKSNIFYCMSTRAFEAYATLALFQKKIPNLLVLAFQQQFEIGA